MEETPMTQTNNTAAGRLGANSPVSPVASGNPANKSMSPMQQVLVAYDGELGKLAEAVTHLESVMKPVLRPMPEDPGKDNEGLSGHSEVVTEFTYKLQRIVQLRERIMAVAENSEI